MSNKDAIKFENFKLSRQSDINYNAGITILAIGIIIFSLPLLNLLQLFTSYPEPRVYPTTFGEIQGVIENLAIFYGVNILDNFNILLSGAIGWGIAGFLSAIIFGKEGKSGPLYASYILLRFFVGLLIIIVPIFSFGELFEVVMLGMIVFTLLIISLVMVIISGITYRIGLWISPN